MAKKTNNEIAAIIRNEIDAAVGETGSETAELNRQAIAYYEGRMQAAPKGRSQMVSMDVQDTIHALMAQATDMYQSSSIVFVPDSEDDEITAQMESEVVKSVLDNSDIYKTLNSASFDAMLLQNGWLKAYVDEDITTQTQQLEGISDEGLLALSETPDPTISTEIEKLEDAGKQDGVSLYNATISITQTIKTVYVDAVPPENMVFSMQSSSDNLDELTLVGERKLFTVSELIELDISKKDAMALPDYDRGTQIATQERDRKQSLASTNGDSQDATRLKEVYCVYVKLDENGDGTTALFYCMMGRDSTSLLLKEPAQLQPYVTGSAVPMPHRILGKSLFEIQKSIQESKTSVLRQYLDNLEAGNLGRMGYVEGKVDAEELNSGRVNANIPMKHPDALFPIPNNDIGATCITGLNYLDEVRRQRGAAALDLTQGQMQIANSSAAAATGEINNKEKMAAWYVANMANNLLRGIYLKTHDLLRLEYDQPIDANIRGKWIKVDPSQWKMRRHAKCHVGLTSVEKQQRTMMLQGVMAQQTQWIAQGQNGILTDPNKLYNAAADWIRSGNVGNVEDYLIDPQSEEAQQAAQQQAQAQQQQEQQMQQMMEQQQQMQMLIESMKEETQRWKTEQELRFKYFDSMMDNDTKEAELTLQTVEKMKAVDSASAN